MSVWVAVAVAAVAACVPFWLPEHVPTNDGPQHLASAYIAVHMRDPDLGFARYLDENPSQLAPILGDAMLRGLLRAGLPPLIAQKVFLTLWVAALAAALVYLASWRLRAGALLAIPGLLTVHGLAMGMGFFEYLWSLPLGLAALGSLLRDPDVSGRSGFRLAALLLASVFAHPFTLAALLPLLALVTGPRPRALARLGAAAAPAVALVVAVARSYGSAHPSDAQATRWAPLGESLSTLAFDAFAGVSSTGWAGLLGAVAILALGAPAAWRDGGRGGRVLLVGAALYAALTVMLPSSAFDWALLHHRFAPLAWLVALAAVGAAPLRRPRIAAATCAIALVVQVVIAARGNLAVDEGLREYLSGTQAVPRAARLLPLDFDPRGEAENRLVRPYLHAWAYVLMERGGMTPYLFATRPVHLLHFRERPPAPGEFADQEYSCRWVNASPDSMACRDFHQRKLAGYAKKALGYDAVLTWKAPPELDEQLRSVGFVQRHASARSAVYTRL